MFFHYLNETLLMTLGPLNNTQRYNLSIVQIWCDSWQAVLFPFIVVAFHGFLLLKMKRPYPWLTIPLTASLTLFLQVFCEASCFSLHVTLQGLTSFFFLRTWDVTVIWERNPNDPDWLFLKNSQNRWYTKLKIYFIALLNIKPCGGWYPVWLSEQQHKSKRSNSTSTSPNNQSESYFAGLILKFLGVLALIAYFFVYPFGNDLPLVLDVWKQPQLTIKYCIFVFLMYLMITLNIGGIHIVARKLFPEQVQKRPIFRSPWLAISVREFWGTRWNLFYRDTFHRIVFIPIRNLIDAKHTTPMKCHKNQDQKTAYEKSSKEQRSSSFRKTLSIVIAGLSTFTYSALLHEYFIYTFFRTFTMEHTVFFMFHGLLLAIETVAEALIIDPLLKKFTGMSSIVLGLRRLFNVYIFISMIPLFANPFIRFDIFDYESNKFYFENFTSYRGDKD